MITRAVLNTTAVNSAGPFAIRRGITTRLVVRMVRGPWLAAALLAFGMVVAENVLVMPVWASAPAPRQLAAFDTVPERVVKIFGAGGLKGLYAYGTGILVSPVGHIATVWSPVLDNNTVTIVLHDGRRFVGKVVAAEFPLDLAIIKIDAENLPHFDLSTGVATAGPGTRVVGFSNMFKVATGNEAVSAMHGVIAAKTVLTARRGVFESPYNGPVYVVDANTNNPGAGGGALTTTDGKLLGMIGKELRNTRTNIWMNYVIPIEELAPAIQDSIDGAGRRLRPADQETDAAPRLPQRAIDAGIVLIPDLVYRTPPFVEEVVPGSAAATAGLQPGDLIIFLEEELVSSCRTLQEQLAKLSAGSRISVIVRRDGTLVSLTLKLPESLAEGAGQ